METKKISIVAHGGAGSENEHSDGTEKDCRYDSCHSVFGKVIDGIDVLDSISTRDPGTATTSGDIIKTITIQKHNTP